ncbi:MAG: ATP-dependent Lon protease [Gammaproteobacteria bacterium]|jgi:ATP-dependent Lon protease
MSATIENPVTTAYPVFPLKNGAAFPNMMFPITAGRSLSLASIEAALATEDKQIAVFSQRDASIEEPTAEDLYTVGTLCVIKHMQRHERVIQLMVQGIRRIERVAIQQSSPYPVYQIKFLPELDDSNPQVEALHRTMLDLAAQMLSLGSSPMKIDLEQLVAELERPIQQAYVLSSFTSIDVEKQNRLLAAHSQQETLQLVVDYLTHEVQVLEVQNQISSSIKSKMTKEQQDMMLRQQLREIQSRLGETSPEQAEVAELRKRLEKVSLPELVRKEVDKELSRLERMSANSADYQTSRGYVDLVLELPWQKTTEDNLDLKRAREILDEDHFDLKEVKDRIIEHLAVMKLNPSAKAPILCFVGPPGVGKTSLGQSIARALGREFERMSLGGLHDEAELRGHRRTYVGAMPGRVIRAIRRGGVKNPLIMLDEIDKLGRDFRGDPAAALMEILDPSQNVDFQDNYLDLPFDLSQVFFIATANTLDSIPGPLLDRIEVLRLSGYTDIEKREIARRYILDRRLQEVGLKQGQLIVGDIELDYIIQNYTREAGVRSLERALGRVARKVATRFAEGHTEPVTLTIDMMTELLGPARMARGLRRKLSTSGIVAGLAWTEAGGEVLYVEALLLPEGKDILLTGQLGSVMQESARAAQSYIWSQAQAIGIDPETIRKSGVHIHVPAGATPKDGPSAGVTMVTALASAYSGLKARNDTAMTGEITLSGLVLPIGGLKEKVLAAHRAGFKQVILPKDNEADLAELPDQIREDIQFVLAEQISDVLAAAIPELTKPDNNQP